MAARASVAIRLGTEGKATVKADLREIASDGDAVASRWARAFEKSGQDVEAAMRRQALLAEKLAQIVPATPMQRQVQAAASTSYTGGSAQESARFFAEQARAQAELEARTRALVSAIDPAWAAQQRFNREMAEARALVSAGAISLDQYCDKLRLERAALDDATRAGRGHSASQGQMRAGTQQLSYSIGDFATQVSMGQGVLMAFSAQMNQTVNALAMMQKESKGVIGFLGGPWGAVFQGAVLIGGMFLAKVLESRNALAEEEKKLRDAAKQSEIAGQAKDRFANSIDGVREAVRQQAAALRAAEDAEKSAARLAWEHAKAEELRALSIRKVTLAKLEEAKAEADAQLLYATRQSREGGEGFATGRMQAAQRRVAELEKQIAELNQKIPQLEQQTRQFAMPYVQELTGRDAVARLEAQQKKQLENLREKLAAERASTREAARQLKLMQDQQRVELERLRERERADNKRPTDPGETTRFIDPVSGRMTGRYGEDRGNHRHAGVDYAVPVGTGIKSAAAGTVVTVGQLPGYGNVVIVDHGGGTTTRYAHLSKFLVSKGQAVGQGDIIGLSGGARGAPGAGNSEGPHLHYEVRQGGRAVDPRRGTYRTDNAQAQLAAEREAEQKRIAALREYEQALEAIQGKYDPLTVAARKYREELELIKKAQERGDITPGQAAAMREAADRQQRESQIGWQVADAAVKAIKAEREQRAQQFADRKRDLAEQIAFAETELSLVAANDNVRARELSKLQFIQQLKRDMPWLTEQETQKLIDQQAELDRIIEKTREQQAAWQTVRDIGGQLIDDVLDPANWEDWGAAGKRILMSLLRDMMTLAAINPLKNALFGTDLPTMGGLLGNLLGGGNFLGKFAPFGGSIDAGSAPLLDVLGGTPLPRLATGTYGAPGGWALLGENGPELGYLPTGSRVVGASGTRQAMADLMPSRGDTHIHQHFHNQFAGNAATIEDAAMLAQAAKQGAIEAIREQDRRAA
jgi:murein DD-endopeptidase MepM/ murein hydrolase activator NlpD